MSSDTMHSVELLCAAIHASFPELKADQHIRVVAQPQYTRNLFGPLSEIAGKQLRLLERNPQGDCLCLFDGRRGTNLVDVDHRDIQPGTADTKGTT